MLSVKSSYPCHSSPYLRIIAEVPKNTKERVSGDVPIHALGNVLTWPWGIVWYSYDYMMANIYTLFIKYKHEIICIS